MITVVTENDERTFRASTWTINDDQLLTIGADTEIVAQYATGGWQYVLQADSEVRPEQPDHNPQDSH